MITEKFYTLILAVAMLAFIIFALRKWGGSKKKATATKESTAAVQTQEGIPGEVLAALSAALFGLSENQHDAESAVLTIKSFNQSNSPWGSKSLTLKRAPHK
ncbi:MAG: hypothetical protein LBS52_06405 [Dysgonamonadaceae bacterium]|jgi:hypothetical protein|nr:hypothetical protein [Dysgonamonadaceae bacterium]